jgi:hypothetical protein
MNDRDRIWVLQRDLKVAMAYWHDWANEASGKHPVSLGDEEAHDWRECERATEPQSWPGTSPGTHARTSGR